MCDNSAHIFDVFNAAKRVEQLIGRKITKTEIGIISVAWQDRTLFTIDNISFNYFVDIAP